VHHRYQVKFATGVNHTSGKFAVGITYTVGKFATGINDTNGKFCPEPLVLLILAAKLPQVSMILAANLLPVSTPLVANNGKNIRLLVLLPENLRTCFEPSV
jgi:hypothetical protein